MSIDAPRLRRIQIVSGLVFGLFLAVHLVNTALAAVSAAAYDDAQRVLRAGYQAPGLELVLVLVPLVVHAGTGVLTMAKRRAAPSLPVWLRLHRYAGRFLLVFVVGHVVATRGASLVYGVFPGFRGVAFTFTWVPAYFWPYYTLLALAGVVHLIVGTSLALGESGLVGARGFLRGRGAPATVAIVGALVLSGVLGLGGVLRPVEAPASSDYAKLLVRLGVAKP